METFNITNKILADINKAMTRRTDRNMLKAIADYEPREYGWFRSMIRKWLGISQLEDYVRVHVMIRVEDLEQQ